MRTTIVPLCLLLPLCHYGMRVRQHVQLSPDLVQASSQRVEAPQDEPPDGSRLVGKEEMRNWRKWKNDRTRWKRFVTWFAWGVLNRGSQREAMEAEFNSIFHRLVEDNPILDAAQALVCIRTSSKAREHPPSKLALRAIKLECTLPVSLFDLEETYPHWKEQFGIYTTYNNTMEVLENFKGFIHAAKNMIYYAAGRTENETTADDTNSTSSYVPYAQRISFVITDARSYPYHLGARAGFFGGRYDDPYVVCLGGGLEKSREDRSLPLDALPKRCTGFLGAGEVDNMLLSVIESLKGKDMDAFKNDIKYMAQWLILSGFDGKNDEFNSKEIGQKFIKKANELGVVKLVVGNWQTLYEIGKLFAAAWLDRLEGKQLFLPVDQLVDLDMISETNLQNILLPLGSYTNPQGQDTAGEKQWEKMNQADRHKVIKALASESERLRETVESLVQTMKRLAQGKKSNAEIALQLRNLAMNECSKLEGKSDDCIKLLKSNKTQEDFSREVKLFAKDVVKVEAAEVGLSEMLSLGARSLDQHMNVQFDPVTFYDHTEVINTAPTFQVAHDVHQTMESVGGMGRFLFPGFTQNIQNKVQAVHDAVQNAPHEFHQNFHAAQDLMPGSATLRANFDMHATEQWGGLAEFMQTGNPDHMHAAIHVAGQLGIHEDGVITGAVDGADAVTQSVVGALNKAAEHSPMCARIIQDLQGRLAHHALNGTAASAAHDLTGHVQGFAQGSGMSHLADLWPDTVQRNAWLHFEEATKHHFQSSLDQIDWLHADNAVKDSLHQLNTIVKFLHPHVDAHVKYDVLGSAKIVNGQLVLHEVVKLHPDAAVHSGFLFDLAHSNPLILLAASSPFLHFAWLVYRIGMLVLNLRWYQQMNDIVDKWNQAFSVDKKFPTACVCQGDLSWPPRARGRNPDEKWRKTQKVLPEQEIGRFWTSKLKGKMYKCKDVCQLVSTLEDGKIPLNVGKTWIDNELNEQPVDPYWRPQTIEDGEDEGLAPRGTRMKTRD